VGGWIGRFDRSRNGLILFLVKEVAGKFACLGYTARDRQVTRVTYAGNESLMSSSSSNRPIDSPDSHPMRNAVRFPLRLPVRVELEDGGFIDAFTEDISASGVLFAMENAPEINTRLTWTLRMPADVMGAKEDVTVNCVGRVVWQRSAAVGRQVGVVIDDYRMGDRTHE
jgi:hypothetical protein